MTWLRFTGKSPTASSTAAARSIPPASPRLRPAAAGQDMRRAEVPVLLGDASKAKKILGWKPKVNFEELVKMMAQIGFSPGEAIILGFLVWEVRRLRTRVVLVEHRIEAVFKPVPVKENNQ